MSTLRAVLVGMPGTGKTSVGRRLADLLEVDFADSDDLVIARAGRSVADIFATEGEARFREIESDAIVAALQEFGGVLALGGGAILNERTRTALHASTAPVVLLKTGLASLLQRVGDAQDRPLLSDDPQSRLAELAEQRAVLYRDVATVTVDTERRSVSRVAEVIARLIADEPEAEQAAETRDQPADVADVAGGEPLEPRPIDQNSGAGTR
ncbi:shikimate kinase [Frankineae bacterium MT45]|nr:shikimate kinase [Frankineae bacterium MT45]